MLFMTSADITFDIIDYIITNDDLIDYTVPSFIETIKKKKKNINIMVSPDSFYCKYCETVVKICDKIKGNSNKCKKCSLSLLTEYIKTKSPEFLKDAIKKRYANLTPEEKILHNKTTKLSMRKSREKRKSTMTPEESILYKQKARDSMRLSREKQKLLKQNIPL